MFRVSDPILLREHSDGHNLGREVMRLAAGPCSNSLCSGPSQQQPLRGEVDLMDVQYKTALFDGRQCGTPLSYVAVEGFKSPFQKVLSRKYWLGDRKHKIAHAALFSMRNSSNVGSAALDPTLQNQGLSATLSNGVQNGNAAGHSNELSLLSPTSQISTNFRNILIWSCE